MIGASAGFTLRYVGFAARFAGRYDRAALIAASTSRAAPSMSRFRSNCRVIDVVPSELADVISLTPAMWPNCRSSGVAIDDAMISALAPGKLAPTAIVGKSTCGSGDTGSTTNAIAPATATAIVSSVVATGRSINVDERLISLAPDSPRKYPATPTLRSSAFERTAAPAGQRRCRSLALYTASK